MLRPISVAAGGTSAMRLLLRFVGLLFAAGTIVFIVGIAGVGRVAVAFLRRTCRTIPSCRTTSPRS